MKLGRLEQLDLRDQWKKEDTEFTPWLAEEENIELLSETIGIGLEILKQEEYVGPFRADILCLDTDNGNYVLIENQLERTDHLHLGQLMTYASGLNAVTIIWIARRFTEEHRAALDWLNEITCNTINFFGIEVELYKINDSLPAPMFKVVSKPNEWKKSVKKTASNSEYSDKKQLKFEYWQELKVYLEETRSLVKLRRPQPVSWSNISIGKSDIFIGASIATKGKITISLFICGNNSRDYFDKLEAIAKERSYSLISDRIQWKRFENQKQQLITLIEDADITNKSDWKNQFAWFKRYFESYVRFFKPLIKDFK